MSESMISVMNDSYEETFNYTLDNLIRVFKGQYREWALYYKHFGFTKHFRVKQVADIAYQIKKQGLGFNVPYEIHFTTQLYSIPRLLPEPEAPRYDWNLVIDIDLEDFEVRKESCKKICSLLNKVGLYYLVDSRYHIWFPSWENLFIEDWNSLYHEDEFCFGLKAYLETHCDLPDCVDEANFRNSRKLFRSPFTLHLNSGEMVTFVTPKLSTIEEFEIEWYGKNQSVEVLEGYARRFQKFLAHARSSGHQLHLMKTDYYNDGPISKELFTTGTGRWKWIEELLTIKIPKGKRDLLIYRYFLPYLVNVRKLAKNEVTQIIHHWLDGCSGDRKRDYDLYRMVERQYQSYQSSGYYPPKLERFKYEHPTIASLLIKQ